MSRPVRAPTADTHICGQSFYAYQQPIPGVGIYYTGYFPMVELPLAASR